MSDESVRVILALTAHARDVPAREREALASAVHKRVPAGSVRLVTCHRVEAYVHATLSDVATLHDILPPGARIVLGEDAIRHVVSVAVGRDSVVLAEDEILHQLRESLEAARRTGIDPTIERLFGVALNAGRRARSWQQGRRRSLGDVAVEAIRRRRGSIERRRVLVVGAGKMGTLAAHAAVRAGADVTIANRSPQPAAALAAAVGARTTSLDPGAEVGLTDAVIVALGAPWELSSGTSTALGAGEAVVVDLSFPAAVGSSLAASLGDRLLTADEVALDDVVADEAARRLVPRLDALVDESARGFSEWLALSDARNVADALVKRADADRQRELELLWRQLPALAPDARQAIEEMTRHLASRLLHEPLERLGRDPDGPEGSVIRDLFAL
jgi:glutamyl-tRNA reductase